MIVIWASVCICLYDELKSSLLFMNNVFMIWFAVNKWLWSNLLHWWIQCAKHAWTWSSKGSKSKNTLQEGIGTAWPSPFPFDYLWHTNYPHNYTFIFRVPIFDSHLRIIIITNNNQAKPTAVIHWSSGSQPIKKKNPINHGTS